MSAQWGPDFLQSFPVSHEQCSRRFSTQKSLEHSVRGGAIGRGRKLVQNSPTHSQWILRRIPMMCCHISSFGRFPNLLLGGQQESLWRNPWASHWDMGVRRLSGVQCMSESSFSEDYCLSSCCIPAKQTPPPSEIDGGEHTSCNPYRVPPLTL